MNKENHLILMQELFGIIATVDAISAACAPHPQNIVA